jgi:PIN domain nuclease of toxin-antitoxin system
VYVSAASIWEVEIKRAVGRLRAPEDLTARVDDSGYERLPITFEHAREAGRLPLHHRDPFDRVLVAQARLDGLTLMTADQRLARYDVPIHRASRRPQA